MAIKASFILLVIASQSICVTAIIFQPEQHHAVGGVGVDKMGKNWATHHTTRSRSFAHRHQQRMGLYNSQYNRSNPLAFLHHSRIPQSKSRIDQNHGFYRFSPLTLSLPAKQLLKPSSSSSSLSMSLIPIPVNELQDILPTPYSLTPNADQYVTYLGRTPKQRYNSLFEGVSIAFLGSMFAYFISFVIGQFLATIMGVIFLFWPILSPEFKAYQRNWELVGGRDLVDVWMDDYGGDDDDGYYTGIPEDKRGLYGAYYTTRIEDVCVVDDVRASAEEEYDLEEFCGYTMANDELENVTGLPWKLRLRLSDDEGRDMQVHGRLSEDYLGIRPGMDAVGVLLSTSKEFGELAGMTDFCVLDEVDGEAIAWVGDYPYLDKDVFLRTLNENGVTESLLDYQEEEDDVYKSGDQEEAEEYINVR